MALKENEFLRDQVNRLTDLLRRYQEKYPNSDIKVSRENSDKTRNLQPSLDENQLSPLLREYDSIIFDLHNQLDEFQKEIRTLQGQTVELVAENNSLREELKQVLQSQISSERSPGGDGDGNDEAVISNLQQQLDMALQEKEATHEKWRESAQEVDRLETELEMEKESHQWRNVEKQAHQLNDQYQQSVSALNDEIEALHNHLRETKTDNANMSAKILELKSSISNLQQQLIWKEQDTADTIFKEGVTDSKIEELKRIMDELRQRLADVTQESNELRRENTVLHTRTIDLSQKLTDAEIGEAEATNKVREAIQMVEAAVLEKDQAEVVARQKEDELDSTKGMISKLINKAGERTREEVDAVRKQCNDRIAQLTEELHGLEMDSTEKQVRLDRLIREKRAVESELQQFYKEGQLEGSKSKESYDALNKRAIIAERAQDESKVKIDSLECQIDALKMKNEQVSKQLDAESKSLKERLTNLQSEFEVVNENRESYQKQVNELNKKLMKAQQEKEASYRKYQKELALSQNDQQAKTRDLEVKLQSTEDAQRQSVIELRTLLTAQQRMSARWKEECHSITHKFECKISDMRGEQAHLKKRNEELTNLLKDSQSKTVEVQHMISEYTRNIHRMEERVREAEALAGDATKQLARKAMRERHMNSERESLLAELARSQSKLKDSSFMETSSRSKTEVTEKRGDLRLDELTGSTNGRDNR